MVTLEARKGPRCSEHEVVRYVHCNYTCVNRSKRFLQCTTTETKLEWSQVLMLPRHRSECELEPPFQKPYYENQFGTKSIGELKWKPHIRNGLDWPNCQGHSPKSGNGLDWFSSIRCPKIEKPAQSEKPKLSSDSNHSLPEKGSTQESIQEIDSINQPLPRKREADPEGCSGTYERTLEQTMGRRKKVLDCRNGIIQRAPGDKSYYTVEYEPGFHCRGSTLPVANFGGPLKTVPDTFIPLVRLPLVPRIPFRDRERKKQRAQEIDEVKDLDFWRPAEPLEIP